MKLSHDQADIFVPDSRVGALEPLRRLVPATDHTTQVTDRSRGLTWAMDLTPLVKGPALGVREYVRGQIERPQADVDGRVRRFCP
ncbi:MAG: hypothetical protein JNG82_03410 [Opitutaceae bacterium]|nr:hypothetical protein [Opitutaceae bacterium]